MNDFQRLLERERQHRHDRTADSEPQDELPISYQPSPTITSWRETAERRAPLPVRKPVGQPELEEYADDPYAQTRTETRDETRPPPTGAPLLECRALRKTYHKGATEIPVLRGVDLAVYPGEFVAVVGQSGCGKSTLLHLLATLDRPDSGEICYQDKRIDNVSARVRDTLRNKHFGMIFQFYHLLPELTTLENVLSPLMISQGILQYRWNKRRNVARARQLLDQVGLSHRLKHKPKELSGGEMQRAAIARALIGEPHMLLADEPTGNLDQSTGREILRILRTISQERGLTTVMVTHDPAIAAQADRVVKLTEGRVA